MFLGLFCGFGVENCNFLLEFCGEMINFMHMPRLEGAQLFHVLRLKIQRARLQVCNDTRMKCFPISDLLLALSFQMLIPFLRVGSKFGMCIFQTSNLPFMLLLIAGSEFGMCVL